MDKLKTKKFWLGLLERCIKTFAEVFLGTIGGSAMFLQDVNWLACLSAAGLGVVTCILINFATLDNDKTLPPLPEDDTGEGK